jgi:hypothetical protein
VHRRGKFDEPFEMGVIGGHIPEYDFDVETVLRFQFKTIPSTCLVQVLSWVFVRSQVVEDVPVSIVLMMNAL